MSRVDADGRTLLVKELRLVEPVPGRFQHTLDTHDRLDQLAQRYYRKPRKWWRICDANPEFASPLAMLGQEPLVTFTIPVPAAAPPRPWAAALSAVRAVLGVDDVKLEIVHDDVAGEESGIVTVRFNELNTTVADLVAAMVGAGLATGPAEPVRRVGKPITIPTEGIR